MNQQIFQEIYTETRNNPTKCRILPDAPIRLYPEMTGVQYDDIEAADSDVCHG